uniref:Arm_2 domain-containing protein n=1 Tax=Angiostrongylus cantonensis TaxID=6313 RepID=A0A0K0D2M6_ANGCA
MLVQCNAPAVLAPQLAHDSERLVQVSLECLRNISDVPTDANRFDLLRSLLRLFGHRNQKVIRYTLDILANLCANNKINKVSRFTELNNYRLLREMAYSDKHSTIYRNISFVKKISYLHSIQLLSIRNE